MDYTKDAVLIHEGLHSFEDDDETTNDLEGHDDDDEHKFDMFSFATLSNVSDIIGIGKEDLVGGLGGVIKGNGSFSSSSAFSPSLSPSLLENGRGQEMEYGYGNDQYNDTMDYIPMSMRPETYIVPVLFAIIFIIGVVGNGTLIVIFIKHRFMRNVPNMFIVSLAIGDLLVILFCVPFTSTVYTLDSWPYGVVVCKFSEFIKDLSVGVSVFTLTALSADRYFAIVDPMRKLTGRRATRITIISIVGIWLLSILVALPSALYSYIRVFPEDEELREEFEGRTFQVCYPYPTEFGKIYAQVMVMFHFLVYYAIPLFFIGTFYIIMARHLVLSTRNMPGEAQGQVKQIQARKKVAKMILSFVVIFAICFFPHHLFLLWFYFYPDSENSFNAFWNICRIMGFCLSFMNSCINPITLYCVSGTFRKQFNDHLFCCFCDNSGGRTTRGGHISLGGTLPGGNGGRGGGSGNGDRGGRGGLCSACVTGSNGNDPRYGSSPGGGGNGRAHRGSTWESSDRLISKRKSTWETQTTMVNHRVVQLSGGLNGSATANIHVNLCSEHENIPLKTLRAMTTTTPSGSSTQKWVLEESSSSSASGTSIRNHNHHKNHQHCFSSRTSSSCSTNDQNFHGHDRDRGVMMMRNGSCNSFSERRGVGRGEDEQQHLSHKLSPRMVEANATEVSGHKIRISRSKSFPKNGERSKQKHSFWVSPTKKMGSSGACSSLQKKDLQEPDIGEMINFKNNNDYSYSSGKNVELKKGGFMMDDEDDGGYITSQDNFENPSGSHLATKGRTMICYN